VRGGKGRRKTLEKGGEERKGGRITCTGQENATFLSSLGVVMGEKDDIPSPNNTKDMVKIY